MSARRFATRALELRRVRRFAQLGHLLTQPTHLGLALVQFARTLTDFMFLLGRDGPLALALSETPANNNSGKKPQDKTPAAPSPAPMTTATRPPPRTDGFTHCATPAARTGRTIAAADV